MIAQLIGERPHQKDPNGATFVFFRGDSTRNHAAPQAATPLCQLFDIHPVIKWRIHDLITKNHFSVIKFVEHKLGSLILSALTHLGQIWGTVRKIVLIMDGLD